MGGALGPLCMGLWNDVIDLKECSFFKTVEGVQWQCENSDVALLGLLSNGYCSWGIWHFVWSFNAPSN